MFNRSNKEYKKIERDIYEKHKKSAPIGTLNLRYKNKHGLGNLTVYAFNFLANLETFLAAAFL